MPPAMKRPASRRILFGLLALVCVALVLILLVRRDRPTETAVSAPPPAEEISGRPDIRRLPPLEAHVAETEPEPQPPIIDEIKVEKQEVCEGEENLITVKAHTPAGRDDAHLHYFIGTSTGQSVPLRTYLPSAKSAGQEPEMQIRVFGRNNVATTVPVPRYTVKRCRPERVLFIKNRGMPNSVNEFELVAIVKEMGSSSPLRISSYRWSFGDGTKEVTAGPGVVHRFKPGNPDALYSEHLVSCEAVGSDGRTVVGRTALSLRNLEFENLQYHDTLVLSAELTPRFPEVDAQGRVSQRVRLFHRRSEPVRLERVRINYLGAENEEAGATEEHVAGEVLGTDTVPPGAGVERAFHLDTKAHPKAVMVDYNFEGHMADGRLVTARFSLMRPPPVPTPDNGERVMDPVLTQKIMRAREITGKAFVNDEDLMRLEREGAFASLPAQPSPAVAARGAARPTAPVED